MVGAASIGHLICMTLAAEGGVWQTVGNAMSDLPKVILASASPRRRQLLAAAGIQFEVIESMVPEQHVAGEPARDYALRMARDKAAAVSSRFPDAIVVGADTIVVCERQILEKPADADDARRMLAMLSARTHTVITAFALARAGNILESSPVESRVTFRKLGDAEIGDYIATDEPFDKAGAYGIQGVGGGFISHVEGSRDNVMGLPTERVVAALAQLGVKRV
jgi:septum formation protein